MSSVFLTPPFNSISTSYPLSLTQPKLAIFSPNAVPFAVLLNIFGFLLRKHLQRSDEMPLLSEKLP